MNGTTVLGWVLFFVALMLSVLIHEGGHLLTAKKFGMKATQYFAGFGPTLWSFRRGETEYGVKAIPAGGFVKIVGMTPLEELDPADEHRAFYRQGAWRRTIVLSAGSFMHFVIALVLFYVIIAVGGIATNQSSLQVADVSACVPSSVASAGACAPGATPSPALAAGIRTGDKIVALDGTPVSSWDAFSARIRQHGPGDQVSVTVLRDGRRVTVRPVLASTDRPDPSDPSKILKNVGFVGIGPAPVIQHYGLAAAVPRSASLFGQATVETFKGLGKIPASIPKLFSKDRSAANTPASVVGVGKLAGDALSSGTGTQGFVDFLAIVASLNLFVGIFNLLPLLPLDGGHIAILAFERGRAHLARLVGRADPGRVDMTKVMPAAYVVLVAFIGLSLTLVYADIVNPVSNPF